MNKIVAMALSILASSTVLANETVQLFELPGFPGTGPITYVRFDGTSIIRNGDKAGSEIWNDTITFEMAYFGDLFLEPLVKVITTPNTESTNNTRLNFDDKNPSTDVFSPFFLTRFAEPGVRLESGSDLEAGKYVLFISGITSGTGATATYYGTMAASYDALAVPEPSTYALMLLGLAGIGFVARRRMA